MILFLLRKLKTILAELKVDDDNLLGDTVQDYNISPKDFFNFIFKL